MFRKSGLLSLFVLSASALFAGTIPDALTPYDPIDISSGHGIASGTVSTGHNVYGFNAVGGQTLDIRVIVTNIFGGGEFSDDDSMLWIFDSNGVLLADDDDSGPGLQSRIADFNVPASGLYFAGVTTYDNEPTFSPDGVITGWSDDGGSNFGYNLDIQSVPEPSTFALIGFGAVALGMIKRFRRA